MNVRGQTMIGLIVDCMRKTRECWLLCRIENACPKILPNIGLTKTRTSHTDRGGQGKGRHDSPRQVKERLYLSLLSSSLFSYTLCLYCERHDFFLCWFIFLFFPSFSLHDRVFGPEYFPPRYFLSCYSCCLSASEWPHSCLAHSCSLHAALNIYQLL